MGKHAVWGLGHGGPGTIRVLCAYDRKEVRILIRNTNDLIHVLKRWIFPWCLERITEEQDWRHGDALEKD